MSDIQKIDQEAKGEGKGSLLFLRDKSTVLQTIALYRHNWGSGRETKTHTFSRGSEGTGEHHSFIKCFQGRTDAVAS